jgi:hypothetical protein
MGRSRGQVDSKGEARRPASSGEKELLQHTHEGSGHGHGHSQSDPSVSSGRGALPSSGGHPRRVCLNRRQSLATFFGDGIFRSPGLLPLLLRHCSYLEQSLAVPLALGER